MADIFISHASVDRPIAEFMKQHLELQGISVFLAPVSLEPGQHWPTQILNELNSSTWVLFLASRAACKSAWVQQELGAALAGRKKVVPMVWDMDPSELPGWTQHLQALDLRNTPASIHAVIQQLADQFKADRLKGLAAVGIVLAALFALGR